MSFSISICWMLIRINCTSVFPGPCRQRLNDSICGEWTKQKLGPHNFASFWCSHQDTVTPGCSSHSPVRYASAMRSVWRLPVTCWQLPLRVNQATLLANFKCVVSSVQFPLLAFPFPFYYRFGLIRYRFVSVFANIFVSVFVFINGIC